MGLPEYCLLKVIQSLMHCLQLLHGRSKPHTAQLGRCAACVVGHTCIDTAQLSGHRKVSFEKSIVGGMGGLEWKEFKTLLFPSFDGLATILSEVEEDGVA